MTDTNSSAPKPNPYLNERMIDDLRELTASVGSAVESLKEFGRLLAEVSGSWGDSEEDPPEEAEDDDGKKHFITLSIPLPCGRKPDERCSCQKPAYGAFVETRADGEDTVYTIRPVCQGCMNDLLREHHKEEENQHGNKKQG